MTLSGDHVANLNVGYVEENVVDLIASRRTTKNPQKWVVKKYRSQVSELDQLKLKIVILHDNRDKEIHMTQLVGFVAADLVLVDD